MVSENLIYSILVDSTGVAGHRAWDPPEPIPNSEVKPCSVSGGSVVFGHANPGKLAAPLNYSLRILFVSFRIDAMSSVGLPFILDDEILPFGVCKWCGYVFTCL